MPEIGYYTPPERLRRVLHSGITERDGYVGQQCGLVLATVMHFEPANGRLEQYRAHFELLELLKDAEAFVKNRIGDYTGTPHEATFDELRNRISNFVLNTSWDGYRAELSTVVKTALPFVVHATMSGAPVGTVEVDAYEGILKDVERLIEKVRASDFPETLKDQLLKRLVELYRTIMRKEVYGMDGVAYSSAAVVATLALSGADAKSRMEMTKDVLDVILRVEDVILKGAKIFMIGSVGVAVKALLPGAL